MKVKLLPADALSVDAAADRLGLHPVEVYHLVIYRELRGGPAVDRKIRVPEDAIEEYLERQRTA